MNRIKDFAIDSAVEIDLVVKSSEIKTTKTRKPYLHLELTDGTDTISSNIWDWHKEEKPERNVILHIQGTMGEFNGAKQLMILAFVNNPELDLSAFAPQGNVDVETYLIKVDKLISEIGNTEMRGIVEDLYAKTLELWKTAPGAKSIHHAYVAGNLQHCVDVAIKAELMARTIAGADRDLCIAGALIHDIGKLWTYGYEGVVIDFTVAGQLLDHITLGILAVDRMATVHNAGIITLLQHIIASHHGKLEYGSPTTPRFIEAWIINYCDGIDVKAKVVQTLNDKTKETDVFTEKDYTLENRQMLTQAKVRELLEPIVGGSPNGRCKGF